MSKKINKSVQNREGFARMNFLYQASKLMAGRNNTLGAYYGSTCRNIGKRSVLRIDPSINRNLCKKCSLFQKPGINAGLVSITAPASRASKSAPVAVSTPDVAPGIEIDNKAQIVITCEICKFKRKFCVNSQYNPWFENPASVVERISLETSHELQKKSTTEATQNRISVGKNVQVKHTNVEI